MATRPDLVRRGVVAVLKDAVPAGTDVVWARRKLPRRPKTSALVVTAGRVRGPALGASSVYGSLEPLEATWRISSVSEGDRVGLAATGARWMHTVAAGESLTDVRDAVQALLSGTALPGVTVTADGVDGVKLDAGSELGLLWGMAAIGGNVTLTIDVEQLAEVTRREAQSVVELRAYSAGESEVAAETLADIIGGLESTRSNEIAGNMGVVLSVISDIVDITTLAGSEWEARAMCRLLVKGRSYVAHPVDEVTSLEYTATAGGTIQGSVTAP